MTYEFLKRKFTNGTPFLKMDGYRWISLVPMSTTTEQLTELKELVEKYGSDVLPEDGEGRLNQVEDTLDELVLAVADMMGGAF